MIMNYNQWFYEQHKYLLGNRNDNGNGNGNISYNDTKWIDINTRYKRLIELKQSLLDGQPYGVIGNEKSFDTLIDLMTKSNYSFDDINDALIDTYNIQYQNAMSKMLVNTHTVMFSCKNNDKRYVSNDKFSPNEYIIDVPFNQLHFGDRDEFIYKRLSLMHTTENDYYVPIGEFIKSDISTKLGFTILCTVNGFICNNCKIAIDDKGFKFKVTWKGFYDADFIIYKLDNSFVINCKTDIENIVDGKLISFDKLNIIDYNEKMFINDNCRMNCIINIYDESFASTMNSVVNFGVLTDAGLRITNLQKKTLVDLKSSKNVNITIYAIKYLNEVNNVYPAVNYYDIMDSRCVYTDNENLVKSNEHDIRASDINNYNELELCTPPITLNRTSSNSFKIIENCFKNCNRLYELTDDIKSIIELVGKITKLSLYEISSLLLPLLRNTRYRLNNAYESYLYFNQLTSLVDDNHISILSNVVDTVDNMTSFVIDIQSKPDRNEIKQYLIDELYNFDIFVDTIIQPLQHPALRTLLNLSTLDKTFFSYGMEHNVSYYNRPVSEQCFISLKYDELNLCWVFALPNIKHFKGIDNTFYIDDGLTGNEVFKFFVLYTETEDIANQYVEPFDVDTVFDFDKFCTELEKYLGYIRYWSSENKLLKLSLLFEQKYDSDTCVHVLSKIMKSKLNVDELFDEYQSEIHYEPSRMTSLNYDGYDNTTEAAPFAINFLFYTLNLMYNNEDKLQSFLFRSLTNKKYSKRYVDLNMNSLFDNEIKYKINYSEYYSAPLNFDNLNTTGSILPTVDGLISFYGIPMILTNTFTKFINNAYPYTFNVYDDALKHYMLIDNDIDQNYYIQYDDIESRGATLYNYHDSIYIAKLVSFYITYLYDYINDLQTNYKTSYNQTVVLQNAIDSIDSIITKINEFLDTDPTFIHPDTQTIIDSIINDNPYKTSFVTLINATNDITYTWVYYNGKRMLLNVFINEILMKLRLVFTTTGFDNFALPRIRKFYDYLKRINTTMNLYEITDWINNLDVSLLHILDSLVSNNENYPFDSRTLFESYATAFETYRNNVQIVLLQSKLVIDNLTGTTYTNHITPLINYLKSIINDYVFDMYTLYKIDYDTSKTYDTKPFMVTIELPNDEHFTPPTIENDDDITLLFKPIIDSNNNSFTITSLSKICEYTFFNGDEINDVTMNVIDESGNVIDTTECTISFTRISSTSDDIESFDQIINIHNTRIDIENKFETHYTNEDGNIINKKFVDMNYELLIGNHFKTLNHDIEFILNPKTFQQGSIDRIYIPNQRINTLINDLYGNHSSCRMFFKPSQIIHITPNDGNIQSIGCGYFVGQRIYLSTSDNYIFPVIITAIDHSIERGFIEAKPDNRNCKWFEISDKTDIENYLTNTIECTIIPDNISNWLDEYNNSNYVSYNIPNSPSMNYHDIDNENMYSLPGDPIFVTNNTNYIYTRLNWMFNDHIENRFIDDEHKQYNFIYIGQSMINETVNDEIKINMINHHMSTLTNPELYPILRDEPNDHKIWDLERETFRSMIKSNESTISILNDVIEIFLEQLKHASTQYERDIIIGNIEERKLLITKTEEQTKRLQYYIDNLEPATTWYNVNAYDDTLVYIANGRAKTITSSYVENITDLQYTDDMDVFLYDWENKHWIDPSLYSITKTVVNDVQIDEKDNYTTSNVLHSITIIPNDDFIPSSKILIYFGYYKSDIFDSITPIETTCNVRFKPILSLDSINITKNPYDDLYLRKHFDGYERYVFTTYNNPDDFSLNGFLIKRVDVTSKNTNSPCLRLCDLSVTNNSNDYDYTHFDLYTKIPFKDININQKIKTYSFVTRINQPIDSFEPDTKIKLICIQNNENNIYNGNISTLMFDAITSISDEDDKPIVTVLSASYDIPNGTYICTTLQDYQYKMTGGIISVIVTSSSTTVTDEYNQWIKIPSQYIYKELPKEFIIVPHDDVTISISNKTYVTINNKYDKSYTDTILQDNSNVYNPYEYYYDTKHEVRYPISNVRLNKNNERLTIDQTDNPNVDIVKSTYIGICRYSLSRIPENGFINLSGYIPTPLSRSRYEFWLNGKCLTNDSNLHIISPTSIQLCNMTSLRNFEVIELVDDVNDSIVNKTGTVYIGLDGSTYSSYKYALQSNANIVSQKIGYLFYNNQNESLFNYTEDIISNPNNIDIDEDILDNIVIDDEVASYNQLHNIPTLNGKLLQHLTTTSLGLTNVELDDIIKIYDKVWSKEAVTNPFFPLTHRDGVDLKNNKYLVLHVKQTDSEYVVYASGNVNDYFTMYISDKQNGTIDDVNHTLKIIPFIKTGVYVVLDNSFTGKWLHTTFNNESIKIK